MPIFKVGEFIETPAPRPDEAEVVEEVVEVLDKVDADDKVQDPEEGGGEVQGWVVKTGAEEEGMGGVEGEADGGGEVETEAE